MSGNLCDSIARVVAVLVLAAVGLPAFAQLTLLSEELRRGNGNWFDPIGPDPPVTNPTTFSSGPFPDTADNFLTLDSSGLRLKVDQLGFSQMSTPGLQGQSSFWDVRDFTVRFRVDQPLTYTFSAVEGTLQSPVYRLQADGQAAVFGGFPSLIMQGAASRTGVLAPGTYTFTGSSANEGPGGPPLGVGIPLRSEFSVAVPEPMGVSVLGALMLCACRRRGRG
jgi:hypothetical protein